MTISITREFRGDHITRQAGEKLRHKILSLIAAGEQKIEIDFTGVTIASPSFFDEGIAKLIDEGWDRLRLERQVTLKAIHRLDEQLLQKTLAYRGWK